MSAAPRHVLATMATMTAKAACQRNSNPKGMR